MDRLPLQSRQHRQPDGIIMFAPSGWRNQRPSRASPVRPDNDPVFLNQ
jgi:hypothetical protein